MVCKADVQRNIDFNELLIGHMPDDPQLEVLAAFDILEEKRVLPLVALSFIYIEAYCSGELSNEFDEDIASSTACILAGCIQRDYVLQACINWKHHMHMLRREV